MSARSAASPRTRRGWCTSRWTRTAWCRRCCGPRSSTVRPRPKFLYTVPTFHNPAGVTLSVERRAEVLAICREYGVAVVEDNPYGLLGFSGHTYPALRSLDRDVVYLGSFSKTFAAGLRVGWALVPPAVRDRLVLAAESATLCPPSFTQMLVSRVSGGTRLAQPGQDVTPRPTASAATPCCARWRATCRPVARGTSPTAASTCGSRVPEGVDTKAMLPRAVTARVAYASGTGFYADGLGSRQLRLSYCYPSPERITEGVRRLAGCWRRSSTCCTRSATRPARRRRGPQAPSPSTP